MAKNAVVKNKVALNNRYGIQPMSNSDYLGNGINLNNAKIISKLITIRDGFLYADTDDTYVKDLDKK